MVFVLRLVEALSESLQGHQLQLRAGQPYDAIAEVGISNGSS